ncbi:MAG TPA: DUF4124 domain-containing protein [Myxococcota bacterium]|nr:DUF4124 domain-containing protein [Myxococcota bacterium]
MRKLSMGLVGVVLLAVSASAGTLYRWTNADGVVAYADELKRVPEAYRASAEPVKTSSLSSYKQFTPAPAAESKDYTQRLGEHVERLREVNEAAQPAPAPQGGQSIGQVRVNGKFSLALPNEGGESGLPIVVEEHRVRSGGTTTHVYVVRQGDRVLSVVRPHTNQSAPEWMTLEEMLEEDASE